MIWKSENFKDSLDFRTEYIISLSTVISTDSVSNAFLQFI
jgi:hypothetical protein